ncbi:signal peptide protein [Gorillibacterium sp. CAU 1737]|uniref:signal peptide protein n=1 Tax=Gorillibacterium sp. CAU 1737 TaxID=3140362 RepID=UPI00326141B4
MQVTSGITEADASSRKRRSRLSRTAWGLAVLLLAAGLTACTSNTNSVFHTVESEDTTSTADVESVPWDYRIVENTVGDLIGSDMTVLPDNEMLPNDDNYATGDKIWTLQYMDAQMSANEEQRTDIKLSAWNTIKSYKEKAKAEEDLNNLKVTVKTDVGVVGVYKTKYKEKTRNFAVLELPSGNRIKQPIDDARYKQLEKAKTAEVVLEQVHDFTDYDAAYAKFRGWAN